MRFCQEVVIFLLFESGNNVSQFCRIEIILLVWEIIIVGNGGEMTCNVFAISDASVADAVADAVIIVIAFDTTTSRSTMLLEDMQSTKSVR